MAAVWPRSPTTGSWCRPSASTASRRRTSPCTTSSGTSSMSCSGKMMSSDAAAFSPSCPLPLNGSDRILLGHGSGGRMTADLITRCFLPAFRNEHLEKLDDQAVVAVGDARLAFSTDAYVVTPLFFPGGDIGDLAVNGTVN